MANEIMTHYQMWLDSPRVSDEDKETLRKMSQTEIDDAFFKAIAFGTGGMRGVLGPGTNRLNFHTLGRTTVAFGQFLKAGHEDALERGVVISHDNRHFSRSFTLETAKILNKMGFKVYIFDDLRPTPELSYAVRYKHAIGGIMITASHNPKQYNGYKVYDDQGCQLVPGVIAPMLDLLKDMPDELHYEIPLAPKMGETIVLGPEVDDDYIKMVEGCQVHPELDKKDFRVVYTPQHGASLESAIRVFKECGYNIIPVAEQCTHDPEFGGTKSPNPEVAAAWDLTLDYMKKNDALLGVMTDPDGDRCGLAYLSSKGTYERLTGNESAALLIDYLLSSMKEKGTLPNDGVIYDTIVSSAMGRKVASMYGVACESFLTGFKFIGNRIHEYELMGKGPTFLFGYEESYGCLLSKEVRDKDGVQAILLYTEMALYHHLHGKTLDQAYEELQQRVGFFFSKMWDRYFEGASGDQVMRQIMGNLHENPMKSINGVAVDYVEDYLSDERKFADGRKEKIVGLPPSDVVKFHLEDDSTLTVRPSGTEPKVKFYVEVVGQNKNGLPEQAEAMFASLTKHYGIN